ncbi:UNVERIFIED_CONTAM: hypothetical protein K2H54_003909 [Gekko kuhli]
MAVGAAAGTASGVFASLIGCRHSLPSSPNSSEPKGQQLAHNGAISSEFSQHGGGGRILLLVCNVAGSGQEAVRFGPPLLMWEDRAMSWDQLQQCILGKMCYLVRREAQVQATNQYMQTYISLPDPCRNMLLAHVQSMPPSFCQSV